MQDPMKVGSIVIQRPRLFTFFGRRIKVFVDGKRFARLWSGQSREIYLDPGRYTVSIKMDWFDTQSMSIEIKENQRVFLECGPTKTWYWPCKSLYLTLTKDKINEGFDFDV